MEVSGEVEEENLRTRERSPERAGSDETGSVSQTPAPVWEDYEARMEDIHRSLKELIKIAYKLIDLADEALNCKKYYNLELDIYESPECNDLEYLRGEVFLVYNEILELLYTEPEHDDEQDLYDYSSPEPERYDEYDVYPLGEEE